MQSSPIQLKQLFFRHIMILPKNEEDDNFEALDFDFDGVVIHDGTRIQLLEPTTENQIPIYCINLRITIKNEEGKLCPYSIDMEAAGFFEVLKKDLTENKREELAHINGCSILYSVIREYIMNFTSRCAMGTLVLPTVNFLDKIKKDYIELDLNNETKQVDSKKKKRSIKLKES